MCTRVKHGKRPVPFSTWPLPFHAIDYCLPEAGMRLIDVDHVACFDDPFLVLGQESAGRDDAAAVGAVASSIRRTVAAGSALFVIHRQCVTAASRRRPHHLKIRFRGARHDGPYQSYFVEYHLAHEARAYLAAPFVAPSGPCAALTMDGCGESAITSYGAYQEGR